jgi:hypothetical protein
MKLLLLQKPNFAMTWSNRKASILMTCNSDRTMLMKT